MTSHIRWSISLSVGQPKFSKKAFQRPLEHFFLEEYLLEDLNTYIKNAIKQIFSLKIRRISITDLYPHSVFVLVHRSRHTMDHIHC